MTSSLLRPPFFFSLNRLQHVTNESLETVNQVTHLDLRDNCLDSLDLSTVCNLEVLHCQRNQLGTLTLSGCTLRTCNSSSNRESQQRLNELQLQPACFTRPPQTKRADCCLSLFAQRSNNSQRLSSPQPADTHGPITVSYCLKKKKWLVFAAVT